MIEPVALGALAAGDQPAFFLADLDVIQDALHRALAHHRPGIEVFRRIALLDLVHAIAQPLDEHVVDLRIDDRARTRRTLLPVVAEGRDRDRLDRVVHVAIDVHHDRVLAAHLQDRALDPDLAGLGLRRARMDVQAHLLRSGEGDEPRLRMLDMALPKVAPAARTEVHHSARHPRLDQHLDELRGDGRRFARRLQHHGVAAHDRRRGHPRHDREREIPRRDHRAHAERDVLQLVDTRPASGSAAPIARSAAPRAHRTPGNRSPRRRRRPPPPSSCPTSKTIHAANSNLRSRTSSAARSSNDARSSALANFQRLECRERRLHRDLRVLRPRLLMDADDLGRLRRIGGGDLPAVRTCSPPMISGYSRPSSERTLSSAARIAALAAPSFTKSANGSFLNAPFGLIILILETTAVAIRSPSSALLISLNSSKFLRLALICPVPGASP